MQNKKLSETFVIGKTITFYSYKGGVGRTMSLVNIACLMAKQKLKVLLIDWDLEAPGLHSFFQNSIQNEELGLVDLITDFTVFLDLSSESNNNDNGYIQFLNENSHKYISKNLKFENSKLQIDIIKAGRFDVEYINKLNAINWIGLYEKAPAFFRIFAQFLEGKYDYILIDSRTGLADTSGVCTMLMPQILVLVFTLNNQNLNGILDVAKQSVNYRFDSNDHRNLTVLPLPSRIDDRNSKELANWIKIYKEKFEALFKELYLFDECKLENYFNIAKIPYKPIYAYGENIPVLKEKNKNDFFISYHYYQFLKLIQSYDPIWDILSPEQLEDCKDHSNVFLKNGIEYFLLKNYELANSEFEKSCEIYSKNDLAFYNWGNSIFYLAKSKNDATLYEQCFEKYQKAIELNPKNDTAFINWGNAISELAILKENFNLYQQSFNKFQEAAKLNPNNDSIYNNWGIAILNLAKIKGDESLFKQSFKKFKKSTEINPKNDLAYYNWGNSIFYLAAFKNSEFLYNECFNKFRIAQELNSQHYFEISVRLNIPKEIKENGLAAIENYIESLEKKGAVRLNEARIIILGDKGVGKTSLARRLLNSDAPMTLDNESTSGVDTTLWKLEQENINVRIWDFAGHVITNAVHQFFLSERCIYVIVYDGRSEERNRLDYWLNHMKNYGGDSKAIILVNQRDKHRVEIPINSLKIKYPTIHGIYYFSIRDDKELLNDFRKEVITFIQNNLSWNNQLIPLNYYRVKQILENLFVEGKEYISINELNAIASTNDIDNVEDLLTNLHALGISFWYKNIEKLNTLLLNPEWISDGVYQIINWANKSKKFALTIADFADVFKWESKRYPKDKFRFLFELMKYYEVAYETKEENTLIIPHLLKEDRPEKLPDFPIGESLMLRYVAEQSLPPNTISRFIIRHNEQIKKESEKYLVWRNGVILDDARGSIALVREEDRTITVSVKGSEKTIFASIIRETLNDIFSSYKSKKPELQYRVERFGQIPEELDINNPLWLPDRKILSHAIDGIPYYDENTRQQIFLKPTVNIYNITAQSLISGQGNQFIDNSIHNTFNFQNYNIQLQENINDLARRLSIAGNVEEAIELKYVVKVLEEAENCKTKEEIKKKGIARSLQRFVETLSDEDSNLSKKVRGIRNGIEIAQDISKGYNNIAQWLGLSQNSQNFLE